MGFDEELSTSRGHPRTSWNQDFLGLPRSPLRAWHLERRLAFLRRVNIVSQLPREKLGNVLAWEDSYIHGLKLWFIRFTHKQAAKALPALSEPRPSQAPPPRPHGALRIGAVAMKLEIIVGKS